MKVVSTCALVLLYSAAAACATARDTPNDAAAHDAIARARAGSEVTFHATVVNDPVEAGGHERFVVSDPAGDRLEVDHNTSLAPRVPITAGARLVIHGELYVDPGPRAGVHCTHAHTSSGCPQPGWIEYNGSFYE
jgi:hypothetical protein